MSKPAKTQWDFGELFPPEQLCKVLSVAQLTSQIRSLLEQKFGEVWVTGEVTNLRAQSSGHIYFVLKDSVAQISCVLFRGELGIDRSLVQDGRKVTVRGLVTVYESRGQYQLRITAVELQGIGALQAAFEKLKQKLSAEGLFAAERKRLLPKYPNRLGIVTSASGAAIRDVLHVIERRNPALEIILAPCRVQGEGAAAEIADAIVNLNRFNARLSAAGGRPFIDLILLTRGGGSLEDLWAFNEEIVARAVFESTLPVVSAVGHEIDFTISDFVADMRAATPSAAAEIITEGVFSSCEFFAHAQHRIRQLARQRMDAKARAAHQATERLLRMHPRRRVEDWAQHLDDLSSSLHRAVRRSLRERTATCQSLAQRLARVRPVLILRQRREVFRLAVLQLNERAQHLLRQASANLQVLQTRLRLLGPEQVLARGYSITSNVETGGILRDANQVKADDRIKTRLKSGSLTSRVEPT